MERFLTVGYIPGDSRHIPMIRISGQWLFQFSFCYRTKIKLEVEPDRIVITRIEKLTSAKEGPPHYVQGSLY